ncbi:MAG: hypothetical protein ACR2M2_04955 [Gaiellaceae bacterium]
MNLWMYAQFAFEDGRVEEAISLSRESAEQADAIGWTWWVSGQRTYLAGLALETGDLDAAEREARAALAIGREHKNRLLSRGDLEARPGRVRPGRDRACRSPKYEFTRTPTRFDFEWFGGRLVTETNPIFRAAIEPGAAADALGCRRGSARRAQVAPDLVVKRQKIHRRGCDVTLKRL